MYRVPTKERMQYSAYADMGWSTSLIARRFKRKWDTVDRWSNPERSGAKDLKRTGRPRTTTAKEDRKMVRRYRTVWRKKSIGRRGIDRELKEQDSKASGKPVYRRLKEAGEEMKVNNGDSPYDSPQKIAREICHRS